MAHDLTRRLVTEHQVDQSLYEQAVTTFGEKGLVDLLFLIGGYLTTYLLFNAFAVPAPGANSSRSTR